jgi:outer membrane protein assembly factor BamB
MSVMRPLVVAVGVLIASIAFLSAQDYPQWRGPNRDGGASGFSAPSIWPDRLTRRWQAEVGLGYATPIVGGNLVYTFARQNDDEVVTAFAAATGAVAWRTRYPAPYEVSAAAAAHGPGPKATPLLHRGHLYTLGISGIVSAFDAQSGKLIWQIPADKEHPYYGGSVSPLAVDDSIVVHPGNYGPLTAFDAKSGAVRWKYTGDGGAFASPILAEVDGIEQIISLMDHFVVSLSVSDGRLLWRHPWGRSLHITPLVYRDTVIVSGQNMGVTALAPVRHHNEWSVSVAWETKDVSMFLSNPVIVGDALFGLSHRASGQFFALDAATGKVLWLGEPREATNTAVAKAGDLVFLLNDDAELIVARSSRARFEPIKRYVVADSATWAQPAISGSRIFIKDQTSLALWTVD